jgi:SAM-dependent methyltransferase
VRGNLAYTVSIEAHITREDAVGTTTAAGQKYALGHGAAELARLDRQAASIEAPTRLLLRAAGLAPGMRVLDLGTGLGHVARLVAELVGPTGAVVGVDRSSDALAAASARTPAEMAARITFVEGDVCSWRASEAFDAVIERLLLFHMADPAAVVRHHLANLRAGGRFIAIDFDLGGDARSEPSVPLFDAALRWVREAFRAEGAWPRVGARLGLLLEDAGLEGVTTFGVQPYVSHRQPHAAALLAGVVRSLERAIVTHGIATAEEIQIDTLEQRLTGAMREAGAVLMLPTVVGAWGLRA